MIEAMPSPHRLGVEAADARDPHFCFLVAGRARSEQLGGVVRTLVNWLHEPASFRTGHACANHVIHVPHIAGRLHDERVHSGWSLATHSRVE